MNGDLVTRISDAIVEGEEISEEMKRELRQLPVLARQRAGIELVRLSQRMIERKNRVGIIQIAALLDMIMPKNSADLFVRAGRR